MKNKSEQPVKKKARKKRKPMSPEQKAAAVARLAAAREKRAKENPPAYKNVAKEVLAKDVEDPLSLSSVRGYIKIQRELLAVERKNMRANVKGAIAKVASIEGYIRNMETYIRTGVYNDMFWGEHGENKMSMVCLAPAYNADGTIKRTVGCWYQDLAGVWTQEMYESSRGLSNG